MAAKKARAPAKDPVPRKVQALKRAAAAAARKAQAPKAPDPVPKEVSKNDAIFKQSYKLFFQVAPAKR